MNVITLVVISKVYFTIGTCIAALELGQLNKADPTNKFSFSKIVVSIIIGVMWLPILIYKIMIK